MQQKIKEKQQQRFQFLHRLYEKAEGKPSELVNTEEIINDLDIPPQGENLRFELKYPEVRDILDYLYKEGLLDFAAGNTREYISLTHRGRIEVEQAYTKPEQSTEHFPPRIINVINVEQMVNSQIQQATQQSTQIGSFTSGAEYQKLNEFIQQLESLLPQLDLDAEDNAEAQAEIATIKAQASSSRPKPAILKESLITLRSILEGITGSVIATQLLEQIGPLMEWISKLP